MKRTVIVANAAAADARRLAAARQREHGLQVMTVEQVAARLAGGFAECIDGDALAEVTKAVIQAATPADLGELAPIAGLPGVPGALAQTLSKVWRAGVDLRGLADARADNARLTVLAHLEAAVLAQLPRAVVPPHQLARRALSRLRHAPAVLGPVECSALFHIAPCWEELVDALGPQPGWWRAVPAASPAVVPRVVTCATAQHEVIEAMRWARSLLATGVLASDIAFAAASPGEYDDLILAISREANLDVHFAHGRRALTTADGQAAAALADVLLHGLSQDRVRRLSRLAHGPDTPFGRLPEGWTRDLPRSAPLGSPEEWQRALGAKSPTEAVMSAEHRSVLLAAITMLAGGPAQAVEAGEMFLRGGARQLWRRALIRAPASALEASLGGLRLPDTVEGATSIGWMHAATLACCPRPYVWLLGLNARTWPRAAAEDPLLPDHVVPASTLDPFPVTLADRVAFKAISGATTEQLVLCASRRDATGRLLGLSPLLPVDTSIERLRRARIPEHAMSEQDRMMARPGEFAGTARSISAHACWQGWNTPEITAHDGLVRADHPVLDRALSRTHSATSLRMLLRNPLGFTWHYALGWREPDIGTDMFELDAMQFGNLVHGMLDLALPAIEAAGGLGQAEIRTVEAAVHEARIALAQTWEAEVSVPPAILWQITLERAEQMAVTALSWALSPLEGGRSYGEVAFGGIEAVNTNAPWDAARPVIIPGTNLRIQGRIDRLDLSGNGGQARLVDYKTGKPKDPGQLNGGSELQRCLYAFVVHALLGSDVQVEAGLLFPRQGGAYYPLADTSAALATLTEALLRARSCLRAGHALPGVDAGGSYDGLAFALPASPGALTERKRDAARQQLGDAALIWEMP